MNITEVSGKDSEWLDVVSAAQASSPIPRTTHKVEAKWTDGGDGVSGERGRAGRDGRGERREREEQKKWIENEGHEMGDKRW